MPILYSNRYKLGRARQCMYEIFKGCYVIISYQLIAWMPASNFSQLKDAPTSLFENGKICLDVNNLGTSTPDVSSIPLGEILNGSCK